MDYLSAILNNYLLISAISGWFIAQVLKTLIDLAITKSFSAERLTGAGGMPSAHSATVCALATAAALKYGLNSEVFAISAILAIIVMYDARGVRRETGNQAVILNQIIDYFNNKSPEKIAFTEDNLKELIGHTPLQVIAGALLGIIVGFVAHAILM